MFVFFVNCFVRFSLDLFCFFVYIKISLSPTGFAVLPCPCWVSSRLAISMLYLHGLVHLLLLLAPSYNVNAITYLSKYLHKDNTYYYTDEGVDAAPVILQTGLSVWTWSQSRPCSENVVKNIVVLIQILQTCIVRSKSVMCLCSRLLSNQISFITCLSLKSGQMLSMSSWT
jgi:hypothetical protein